jgi:hypothetical protein
MERLRRGLVLKAHRWLYHSTLGSRKIVVSLDARLEKNKEEDVKGSGLRVTRVELAQEMHELPHLDVLLQQLPVFNSWVRGGRERIERERERESESEREREREREKAALALRAARTHTQVYVGLCDQEQGVIESPCDQEQGEIKLPWRLDLRDLISPCS